jgi:hypothetical protein
MKPALPPHRAAVSPCADSGGDASANLLADVYLVTNWFEELKARMGGAGAWTAGEPAD